MGQDGGGHKSGILNPDTVMDLVALLKPTEDRNCILDARLLDHHRLEASLQSRIFLNILAILVECRGSNSAELTARKLRLEEVGGIHRSLGGSGTDNRVQLVDKENNFPL